ncbi:MAG: DUF4349 domain-containing protein [Gemmatimonadales bacterium]|nr:DUF4349 domain-containing protein [Gemmatimonadales bacterium]
MRIQTLVAGLLQVGLMACGQGTAPVEVARQATEAGDAAAAGNSSPEAAAATSPDELSSRADYPDPASGMIVRTGSASIELDSLGPGLGALRALALRLGGYVANTSVQGGREQIRSATLEIKVPADRFEDLTAGLDPLGRVEFVNVSAQDVGEEFVDLSARAANARRLEERLIDVLGTRTGKLQDVLSVERELARVREEIERLDGRMRYLKSRAALSTLSVTLHEPPPIVGDNPGRSIVSEAFRRAWRNFVTVLAAAIASLGYVVPVTGAVWAAMLLRRRVVRQTA